MHKFTLITLLLTLIVSAITVDVLFNDYKFEKDYIPAKQAPLTVNDTRAKVKKITSESQINTSSSPLTIETTTTQTAALDNTEAATPKSKKYTFADTEAMPTLDQFLSAGIKEPSLKTPPPSNYILQVLPVEEDVRKHVEVLNLFDFEQFLGTIYALHCADTDSSKALYSDLKAQSLTISDVTVKELNVMGDQSFYLNQAGKTKTAFIIVRIGTYVYGFEYPHSSHSAFKSIAQVLSTNTIITNQ